MQELMKRLDTSSWDKYKRSLKGAMEVASELGMSDQEIASLAQKFGGYLAKNVQPDLPENKAMKELWDIASPEEQKTLSELMMRSVRK